MQFRSRLLRSCAVSLVLNLACGVMYFLPLPALGWKALNVLLAPGQTVLAPADIQWHGFGLIAIVIVLAANCVVYAAALLACDMLLVKVRRGRRGYITNIAGHGGAKETGDIHDK